MKNNIVKLESNIQARAIEGNDRQFEFVISDESIDSHRTIFAAEGMSHDRYIKNPIVTYAHPSLNSSNPDDIIGTSELRVEGKSTIAVLTLEPEGDNPLADKVAKKLRNGTLRMASIRAIPTEAEFQERNGEDIKVFTRSILLDWGVVPIGSNPAAMMRALEDAADELIVKEETEEEIKDETIEDVSKADAQAMEIESII